jgi:chromosome segregation ATPase
MFKKKQKTEDVLRRAWFGGVREADVETALGKLEQRNRALESELEAAEQDAQALLDRVTAAEGTLVTFHATLEQMGTLLSLAQERARQIEETAKAEAEAMKSEARARVAEADAEVAALVERKQEAIDALAALRDSLPGGERDREPELAPAPVAVPPRVTVADLIALEKNAGLSA